MRRAGIAIGEGTARTEWDRTPPERDALEAVLATVRSSSVVRAWLRRVDDEDDPPVTGPHSIIGT
jgi:hypothetical protein